MKKNLLKTYLIALAASFAGVVICALLWCTRTGTVSVVFCALTLACAAAFVVIENKIANYRAPINTIPDSTAHGKHAA